MEKESESPHAPTLNQFCADSTGSPKGEVTRTPHASYNEF
jgi:hypothetical protein